MGNEVMPESFELVMERLKKGAEVVADNSTKKTRSFRELVFLELAREASEDGAVEICIPMLPEKKKQMNAQIRHVAFMHVIPEIAKEQDIWAVAYVVEGKTYDVRAESYNEVLSYLRGNRDELPSHDCLFVMGMDRSGSKQVWVSEIKRNKKGIRLGKWILRPGEEAQTQFFEWAEKLMDGEVECDGHG